MRIKLIAVLVAIFMSSSIMILFQQHAIAQTNSTVTVETIEGPTVTEKITEKISESWPWYLVRGSGFVAVFCLVILMLTGIGQITGQTYKFLEPLTAWASHRAIGITFVAAIIVHMFGLLFDEFLVFNLLDILVPWYSDFKTTNVLGFPAGSLYLALGIVSFYLSFIIVITSLVWISKKPKMWKLIHLMSYLVLLFVFFHALMIGTDLSEGWTRIVWILIGNALSIAVIYRSWRANTV